MITNNIMDSNISIKKNPPPINTIVPKIPDVIKMVIIRMINIREGKIYIEYLLITSKNFRILFVSGNSSPSIFKMSASIPSETPWK